jgi:hypothetical protein
MHALLGPNAAQALVTTPARRSPNPPTKHPCQPASQPRLHASPAASAQFSPEEISEGLASASIKFAYESRSQRGE